MADRGAGEEIEGLVVQHLPVPDEPAMAVARVLTEADVAQEHELGRGRPERPEPALDDSVVVVRARPLLVLLPRNPEEEDGSDAEQAQLLRLPCGDVDGAARDAWKPAEGLVDAFPLADEHGIDEIREVEARLSDERSERRRAAKPPKARDGEGRHVLRVTRSSGRPRPASGPSPRRLSAGSPARAT